ncbi:MAG: prolyl oligopeptidase family serine peptidase [Pseudomonadota bacterium]
MPEIAADSAPVGAIVFAHGYLGSATGTMASVQLEQFADNLEFALIAAKSAGDDWAIPGAPSAGSVPDADELAYFDAVLEDVTTRFPIDPKRLVAAGFSAGGMMVWTLACHRSERFAGFVPMAGTFWRPTPERCTSPPASLVHIHGDADNIVPLAGRQIEDAHQGNVEDVLAMYTAYGDFGDATNVGYGELRCRERRNTSGQILDFCLFPGGHTFKAEHLGHAVKKLVPTNP